MRNIMGNKRNMSNIMGKMKKHEQHYGAQVDQFHREKNSKNSLDTATERMGIFPYYTVQVSGRHGTFFCQQPVIIKS